jgi:hypothetical protein
LPWHTIAADAPKVEIAIIAVPIAAAERILLSIFSCLRGAPCPAFKTPGRGFGSSTVRKFLTENRHRLWRGPLATLTRRIACEWRGRYCSRLSPHVPFRTVRALRACRTACNTFFASCCSHPTVFARSPGYIHIRPSRYSSAGISHVGPDRKYHSQSHNDAGINWSQLPESGSVGRWRRSNFETAETNRWLFHNELASRKLPARKLRCIDVSLSRVTFSGVLGL